MGDPTQLILSSIIEGVAPGSEMARHGRSGEPRLWISVASTSSGTVSAIRGGLVRSGFGSDVIARSWYLKYQDRRACGPSATYTRRQAREGADPLWRLRKELDWHSRMTKICWICSHVMQRRGIVMTSMP